MDVTRLLAAAAVLAMLCAATAADEAAPATPWSEIRVVDAATGRGVPLVELVTVNGLRFVTDDTGRAAFLEPGLMGRPIFLHVRSPGYEAAVDGFGFHGRRVVPEASGSTTIEIDQGPPGSCGP